MLAVGLLDVGVLAARAIATSAATMLSRGIKHLAIETIYYVIVWMDSGEVRVLWTSYPSPYIRERETTT
jgi:hypothetical protein